MRLTGELDMAAEGQLATTMADVCAAHPGRIAVDVSELTFIDAAGLNLLVKLHDRFVAERRPGLGISGASGLVRRVFELTEMTWMLDDAGRRTPGSPDALISGRQLDLARSRAGISVAELYVDYFALGGTADLGDVAAALDGDGEKLDAHQREVLLQALAERVLAGNGWRLAVVPDQGVREGRR